MKICIISASFPNMHCGVGDYMAQLVNSLKDFNLEIAVITSAQEKIKQFANSQSLINVTIFPIMKRWGFLNIFTLCRKIFEFKPDVIHIQYQWWMYHGKTMIALLPLLLKILKKDCFIVTTFHDLMGPYLFPKAGRLRKLGIKALAEFSDKIITTNRKDTENLTYLISQAGKKISYIPTGAGIFPDNHKEINSDKIKEGLRDSENQIIISNFGYMLPYKGLEDLLQAVKILIDKKYLIKLLAIGGFNIDLKISSSYFLGLQKQVEILNITPYVKWLGYCSPKEVSNYLIASDICVLPYTDGVSERRTSFISALSHGLPIVTTHLNNTPDKLIDHNNILLVEPKNPYQLADAIEELINHPELRKSLGKAALELYHREYDWHTIAQKTIKTYRDDLFSKSSSHIQGLKVEV